MHGNRRCLDQVPFQSLGSFYSSAALPYFCCFLFSVQRIWSRKDNIPRIMFRSKARRRINNIRISEGKRRARFYRLMQLNGPAWSRFWHRRQLDLFDQSLFIIRE